MSIARLCCWKISVVTRKKKNDRGFAGRLASLADICQRCFSASHAHASIVGVPQYLPSFAGLAFVKEYQELSRAFKAPHPLWLC